MCLCTKYNLKQTSLHLFWPSAPEAASSSPFPSLLSALPYHACVVNSTELHRKDVGKNPSSTQVTDLSSFVFTYIWSKKWWWYTGGFLAYGVSHYRWHQWFFCWLILAGWLQNSFVWVSSIGLIRDQYLSLKSCAINEHKDTARSPRGLQFKDMNRFKVNTVFKVGNRWEMIQWVLGSITFKNTNKKVEGRWKISLLQMDSEMDRRTYSKMVEVRGTDTEMQWKRNHKSKSTLSLVSVCSCYICKVFLRQAQAPSAHVLSPLWSRSYMYVNAVSGAPSLSPDKNTTTWLPFGLV